MTGRRVGCVVVFVLLVGGCGGGEAGNRTSPGSEPRLTGAVAQALDARLRQNVEETGVPGVSAAIVFPDGRLWSGAAGRAVLRPARRMTTQTSLPFASLTKLATAALALRLVERGRLGLDDPVARWYPRWRGDPDTTVRDLLGHTSGLGDPPDAAFGSLERKRDATARDFIALTPKPGPRTEDAVYSNAGFMIAGLILERVAGRTVAAAMRQEVFSGAAGDGLAFQPAEQPHPPLAHGYTYPDGANPKDVSDGGPLIPARRHVAFASTAGALAGDVPSLARWAHELLGGRLLAPRSLHEMTQFRDGAHWGSYGLGVARSSQGNDEVWGHGGEIVGGTSELWHLPARDLTIAIAWNDDLFGRAGSALPALLRIALGPG